MLYAILDFVSVLFAALFILVLAALALQMAVGLLMFKAWTWRPPPPDQDHKLNSARSVLYATNTRTMDRPWVRDRFGEPQHVLGLPEWDDVYNLGPEPGLFSIGDLWLCVEYDDEGFVKAATIVDR